MKTGSSWPGLVSFRSNAYGMHGDAASGVWYGLCGSGLLSDHGPYEGYDQGWKRSGCVLPAVEIVMLHWQ